MGLLEPAFTADLLIALIIISVIFVASLVVTISSIVGIIRAVRRRRRGEHSTSAVVLASIASAITICGMLSWLGYDIYHGSSLIDPVLLISLAACVLPLFWVITAIRANSARGQESA